MKKRTTAARQHSGGRSLWRSLRRSPDGLRAGGGGVGLSRRRHGSRRHGWRRSPFLRSRPPGGVLAGMAGGGLCRCPPGGGRRLAEISGGRSFSRSPFLPARWSGRIFLRPRWRSGRGGIPGWCAARTLMRPFPPYTARRACGAYSRRVRVMAWCGGRCKCAARLHVMRCGCAMKNTA